MIGARHLRVHCDVAATRVTPGNSAVYPGAGMADDADAGCTLTSTGRDGELSVPSLAVSVSGPRASERSEARLELRPLVVGTSPECDLVLVDPKVSRRHCEISLTRDGVVLRDLGSKNGTLLGQAAIREAILPPDVVVTLGGSELVVRRTGAPTRVPMSPAGSFGAALGQSCVMRVLFARLERAALTAQ